MLGAESARGLGFDPVIRFDGPIDSAVDDDLANELFAVVREALTNVAKHAHASSVNVFVDVRDGLLSARIIDNGGGFNGSSGAGRGVDNLRSRAVRHGGTFAVGSHREGGTGLEWSVPIGATLAAT